MDSAIIQMLEEAKYGKHSPNDPFGDKLRHVIDKTIDGVIK